MPNTKFSQFVNGGNQQDGDQVVGLRAGVNTIFNVNASGLPWTVVTAATQQMAVNNGYIANNNTTPVAFTLPATASPGDIIDIVGFGSQGWTLAQNVGQQIHFGNDDITMSTGTVSSTNRHDCITLINTVTNTDFVIVDLIGNPAFT